jgi:hypothetical protein
MTFFIQSYLMSDFNPPCHRHSDGSNTPGTPARCLPTDSVPFTANLADKQALFSIPLLGAQAESPFGKCRLIRRRA